MIRKKLLLLVALVAVIFIWGWTTLSRNRYLQDKAIRYPLPKGWSMNDPSLARLGHCWLSNLTLLVPREVAPDDYEFVRLDLASGQTMPLKSVEALFHGIKLNGESSVWDVSPDGRRLLFGNGDSTNGTYIVGTLDGSREWVWQMPWTDESFVWLRDGAGLLLLEEHESNCVARVVRFGSRAVEEINVPHLADSELLGFTKDRTLLTQKSPNTWSASSQQETKLHEWKVDSTFSPVREIVVRLPQPAEHAEALLSPRGDRLAWNFYCTRKIFSFSRARRFPFFRARRYLQQSLWTSDIDGGRMQKLGDFEPSVVVQVSWTPDGEHLEFLRQNAVHLLRAK